MKKPLPFEYQRALYISSICASSTYVTFINSVRTSKKTQYVFIAKINWLMLFEEIIVVYSENYTGHTNRFTLRRHNTQLLNVEGGGTYMYHWVLKLSSKCGSLYSRTDDDDFVQAFPRA
jgi:hypothetical protein